MLPVAFKLLSTVTIRKLFTSVKGAKYYSIEKLIAGQNKC